MDAYSSYSMHLFGFSHSFSDPRANDNVKPVTSYCNGYMEHFMGDTFDIFKGMLFIVCSNITTNIKVVFFIVGLIRKFCFASCFRKMCQLRLW